MRKIGIGVDIGGSHMACAGVDLTSGEILGETYKERLIDPTASPTEFLHDLLDIIHSAT